MIRSIEIKDFRGIQDGKLEDFTPLVVLVGPNGSGKSAILDALLLGSSPYPGQALGQTLARRKGLSNPTRWLFWRPNQVGRAVIKVQSDQNKSRVTTLSYSDQTSTIMGNANQSFTEVSSSGNASVSSNTQFVVGGISNIALEGVSEIGLTEGLSIIEGVPLHRLYTKMVEQGRRNEIRAILKDVVPGVNDIEILTDGDVPILYFTYANHAVPVVLEGDGVQSLLRLCLELASRPDGVVLMEEPEVHQHPGAIHQSAKAILAAVRRNIQVILTTHSLELIDALLAEIQTDEELTKLAVYGLQLREGCLKSYRLSGNEVSFARTQIGNDLR